jgi:hypothetical protein
MLPFVVALDFLSLPGSLPRVTAGKSTVIATYPGQNKSRGSARTATSGVFPDGIEEMAPAPMSVLPTASGTRRKNRLEISVKSIIASISAKT